LSLKVLGEQNEELEKKHVCYRCTEELMLVMLEESMKNFHFFSDYMLQLLGQFVFVKHKRTFLGKVWNKSLLITFIPMK